MRVHVMYVLENTVTLYSHRRSAPLACSTVTSLFCQQLLSRGGSPQDYVMFFKTEGDASSFRNSALGPSFFRDGVGGMYIEWRDVLCERRVDM